MNYRNILTVTIASILSAGALHAAERSATSAASKPYSQTAASEIPQRPLWGDTHLHTELSQDANNFGVKLDAETAYRFARGEVITATHGQQAQLKRPLDFLVVADHAEGLGSMQALVAGDALLLQNERLQMWRELLLKDTLKSRLAVTQDGREKGWPVEMDAESVRRPAWNSLIETTERYNEPGVFTAFHGFEWTSAPGGSNLHRVVVFRDDAEKAKTILPYSFQQSSDPEKLWDYMDEYERDTGGQVLAIPHNGNISNGLMFDEKTFDGQQIDADYAERRAAREPIYEVTQIKGDGETHPFLSPNDEFADYETWDGGNFYGTPKQETMLQYEYAREALKIGLRLESKLGKNPFKFGMIGSTDSHTALSTPEEDNFYGKHSAGQEPNPKRMFSPVGKSNDLLIMGWEQAASGYAAVWAKDNTREAIWDAMQRRETYATTGSRISLRVFGGWEFAKDDASRSDAVALGYGAGVPMGGDLSAAPRNKKVSLMIMAAKDPLGANLDRVQVVKGWLDDKGGTQEKVFDVVWSNPEQRKIRKGKLTPVGNTVDVSNATYKNNIGAAELSAVWQDPEFDPSQRAFYYVRVLEIPTPRWTTYDAVRFGISAPEEAPKTTQERAYSSPIWYTP